MCVILSILVWLLWGNIFKLRLQDARSGSNLQRLVQESVKSTKQLLLAQLPLRNTYTWKHPFLSNTASTPEQFSSCYLSQNAHQSVLVCTFNLNFEIMLQIELTARHFKYSHYNFGQILRLLPKQGQVLKIFKTTFLASTLAFVSIFLVRVLRKLK